MKNILKTIQYSHLFTALAALAFTLCTYFELALIANLSVLLTNFFGVLLVYNVQSLVYISKPLALVSEAKAWQGRHKRTIWFLIFLACIWLFQLLSVFSSHLFWMYAACAVLAILYYFPKLGLRHVPFLKNIILAMVWLGVCVLIPVYQSEASLLPTVIVPSTATYLLPIHFLMYYLFSFFLILLISFWFDHRDRAIDTQNASSTFVSKLSPSYFMKCFILLAALVLSSLVVIKSELLVVILLLFLYLFIMVLKIRRGELSFMAYGYWGDGLLIWLLFAFSINHYLLEWLG